MIWPTILNVAIKHDFLDYLSLFLNFILGVAAIGSLGLSFLVLKKAKFDSAMSTSPSIVVRPHGVWVTNPGVVIDSGRIIKKDNSSNNINFTIEFECFNAGRGVAFNISKSLIKGALILEDRYNKTPLYLTKEDEPFKITIRINGQFSKFYRDAELEIPVSVSLFYTNDQNNIFCKSIWSANVKIFDREGEDLKVRDVRLLERNGKIEYSQKPYYKK